MNYADEFDEKSAQWDVAQAFGRACKVDLARWMRKPCSNIPLSKGSGSIEAFSPMLSLKPVPLSFRSRKGAAPLKLEERPGVELEVRGHSALERERLH